jgi:glutathione peroxidase-family protein
VKNTPTKEEIENFWKEMFGQKFNTMNKLTVSKTSANKIPVWNGA